MQITFTRELPCDARRALAPYYSEIVILEKDRPLSRSELEAAFSQSDVVVSTLMDRIDVPLLDLAKKLRLLITYSVGVDHIDLTAVKEKGLCLSYTPGALTEATAELTWALILACARKLKPAAEFLQAGKFVGIAPKLFLGLELNGACLGILGMGRIGRAVAEKAKAFGMEVIYHSRSQSQLPGAKKVSFESLLRDSDVLSIHCPLNEATRGLFNAKVLSQMKPQGILINTARGAIQCEKELYAHLLRFPEFSVGLDVFEDEPRVRPELLSLPNAFCVPHIGSATQRARGMMAKLCLDEAIRFAKGEKLQSQFTSF